MKDEVFVPTPQQDDLFQLTVSNFINMTPSHRRLLVDSRFAPTLADIDKWQNKKDLPEVSKRTQIMDFVWVHYCSCKCD